MKRIIVLTALMLSAACAMAQAIPQETIAELKVQLAQKDVEIAQLKVQLHDANAAFVNCQGPQNQAELSRAMNALSAAKKEVETKKPAAKPEKVVK